MDAFDAEADLRAVAWIVFVLILAACIVGTYIERRKRHNRRTGLPTPSDRCTRSPDWRSSTLNTSRKYIP